MCLCRLVRLRHTAAGSQSQGLHGRVAFEQNAQEGKRYTRCLVRHHHVRSPCPNVLCINQGRHCDNNCRYTTTTTTTRVLFPVLRTALERIHIALPKAQASVLLHQGFDQLRATCTQSTHPRLLIHASGHTSCHTSTAVPYPHVITCNAVRTVWDRIDRGCRKVAVIYRHAVTLCHEGCVRQRCRSSTKTPAAITAATPHQVASASPPTP